MQSLLIQKKEIIKDQIGWFTTKILPALKNLEVKPPREISSRYENFDFFPSENPLMKRLLAAIAAIGLLAGLYWLFTKDLIFA